MALIDELKERHFNRVQELVAMRDKEAELHGDILDLEQAIRGIDPDFRSALDVVISGAALTPAPAPVEIEIPEGFTRWDGCEWTGLPSDMVQVIFHDEPTPYFPTSAENLEPLWAWDRCSPDAQRIIAYRIIEAAPADEQDDTSEFAEPAPDPEFVALDEQTCKPLDTDLAQVLHDNMDKLLITDEAPALNEAMQDEREEPVEGYAPVTNPEADALARAHDYYSPEKIAERNKFNPWGGVSNLFGKPKVDA